MFGPEMQLEAVSSDAEHCKQTAGKTARNDELPKSMVRTWVFSQKKWDYKYTADDKEGDGAWINSKTAVGDNWFWSGRALEHGKERDQTEKPFGVRTVCLLQDSVKGDESFKNDLHSVIATEHSCGETRHYGLMRSKRRM